MALNTYYPTYTNQYQQGYNPYSPQQMMPAQLQNAQASINWVSGDREAAAYPVAPNGAVALWSQSEPVVYLKQADATGKPSMKIYDLVERTQTAPAAEEKLFATKEELDQIKEEISSLRSEFAKKKAAAKRRYEEDEE